jgi:beta-lactamase regulating signal transducer with metallopeptidase domain
MDLLFTENILGEELVQDICWTLIHSLWLGIAAAVLSVLVLVATKRFSSALRYNLLLATLFLFLGGVAAVLAMQLGSSSGTPDAPLSLLSTSGNIQAGADAQLQQGAEAGYFQLVVDFLNRNAAIIVMIWMLLLVFRSIKLLTGLRSLNRMKSEQVSPAGSSWDKRVHELALSISVSKPVRLLQSGLVKVPMVAGYFKPVILLPVGLITSLPQKEVEAILLHELSHIRRKDYLVNIVQNLVEAIFFFNPFIGWVSNLIREERENCCDDVAVSRLQDKTVFIKALVACREFHPGASAYALSFAGRKNHLLNRVKRIVNQPRNSFNTADRLMLGFCIPVVCLFFLLLLPAFQTKGRESKVLSANLRDTIPAKVNNMNDSDETFGTTEYVNGTPRDKYTFKRNGVVYQVEKTNNKISSLIINGKEIAGDRMAEHLPVVDKMVAEYNEIVNTKFSDLAPLSGSISETGAPKTDMAKTEMAKVAPLSQQAGLQGLSGISNESKKGESKTSRATYYDKGYKVVVDKHEVVEVYYKGERITGEKMKEHQAEIDAIVRAHDPTNP